MNENEKNELLTMTLSERKIIFTNTLFKLGGYLGYSFERLQNQFEIGRSYYKGKETAAFGFLNESSLDYYFKEKAFQLFDKFFPNGTHSSLIGYPRHLMWPKYNQNWE